METLDFLPISKEDLEKRGWDFVDVVVISADAYVDHPSFGHAVIARDRHTDMTLVIGEIVANGEDAADLAGDIGRLTLDTGVWTWAGAAGVAGCDSGYQPCQQQRFEQ